MDWRMLNKEYCLYDISDQRFEQFQAMEIEELEQLPELTVGYKESINVRAGIMNFWLLFEFDRLLYAPKSDRLLIQDTFVRLMNNCMQSVKHYDIHTLMNKPRASYVYVYFLYYEIYVLVRGILQEEFTESAMFNVTDIVFTAKSDLVLENAANYYLFKEFKKINSYFYANEQGQQLLNRACLKAYKRAYEYLSNENITT